MTTQTEADAERARIEELQGTKDFRLATQITSVSNNWTPLEQRFAIAHEISTARAEGIAQGRAEQAKLDAPVIAAARAINDSQCPLPQQWWALGDALAARDRALTAATHEAEGEGG